MDNTTHHHEPISWLSWRLGLAAVLALAAVIYFLPLAATRIIGQEKLRLYAREALTAALERPAEVQGDVSLTMVPWLGVRAGDVTVANDPGFGDAPILSVSSVSIGLSLTSLFSKRIDVHYLALSSPNLHLERDVSGRENWRPRFIPGKNGGERKAGDWTVVSSPTAVRIFNARLSYADLENGVSLDVSRLNLDTTSERPFRFSVDCAVSVPSLGLTGQLRGQGLGVYDDVGGHVFVKSSEVSGVVDLPPDGDLPGGPVNFTGKVEYHGKDGAIAVTGLSLEGLGARLSGKFQASGLRDPKPSLSLKLRAEAERRGGWGRRLGMDFASGLTTLSPVHDEPSFRSEAPPKGIEAGLEMESSPEAWTVRRAWLRDGAGRLRGSASRTASGEVTFDIQADHWNAGPWLSARLPGGSASGWPDFTRLHGRFSGRDIHVGPLEIVDAELSATAAQGELRLYPVTVRTPQTLLSSDVRAALGGGSSGFSGNVRIQALAPEVPGDKPSLTLAEGSLEGTSGDGALSGRARLEVAPYAKDWAPEWLPEDIRKAWHILGGGSARTAFRLPLDPLADWQLTDTEVRTSYSHLTGTVGGSPKGLSLSAQADRLDLDRLLDLKDLFGISGDDYCPLPLEAAVTTKRLNVRGLELDDLAVAVKAAPDFVKLAGLTGTVLGGKLSATAELTRKSGKEVLTASASASAVRGDRLHALSPELPKATGLLDCRLNLDASPAGDAPLWRTMKGRLELQMAQGSFAFEPDSRSPWPVSRASAGLAFTFRPAPGDDPAREAAVAELSGSIRAESPGVTRSIQANVKGQAGVAASGKPLWFHQPRMEGTNVLALPLSRQPRPVSLTWAGRVEADLDKGGFSLDGVDFTLAGTAGKASVRAQPAKGSMAVTGSIDIPGFNPREAGDRLGLSVQAEAARDSWRTARLSAEMGGTIKEPRLTRIQAALDDITITGQAALSGTKTVLNLSVNALDLDRLAPGPHYPDPTKRPEATIDLQALRDLDVDVTLRLGRLIKDHLVWENTQADFTAQGGRFRLRQSAPDFYGGPFRMELQGDARGQELKSRLELALSGFSASRLLWDLARAENISKGTGIFEVNLDSNGLTDRALRRNTTGTARFEVRDGRIGMADSSKPQNAGQNGEASQTRSSSGGLEFSRLGASFTVNKGLAVTRDFVLTGKSLTAKGDGWVSLDDERIDLNLMAAVPDVGNVPVRISGELYDPKLNIDTSAVIGDTIVNIFKGVISIPGSIVNQIRRVF